MTFSCTDAIDDILQNAADLRLLRGKDVKDDDPQSQAGDVQAIFSRHSRALDAIHELLMTPTIRAAITEPLKTTLDEILRAHAGGPFMSCESYGHCFVGSSESITRWVYDLRKDNNAIVYAEVKIGTKWHRLSSAECQDLIEDIHENDVRVSPGDFDAKWSCRLPEWLPNDVHQELVASGIYESGWAS
jgi:hypothetical protein